MRSPHVQRSVARRVKVVKVDDTGPIQKVTVQGLADEEFELSARGQRFGMTGNPPVGSVGYLHIPNGDMDAAYMTDLEHPDMRPNNRESGEAIAYAKQGQRVELDKDGNILVKSPNGIVHINP